MRKVFILVLLVLSIGFVVAHGAYANMDGGLKMKSLDKVYYQYSDSYHFVEKRFGDWDKKDYRKVDYGKKY